MMKSFVSLLCLVFFQSCHWFIGQSDIPKINFHEQVFDQESLALYEKLSNNYAVKRTILTPGPSESFLIKGDFKKTLDDNSKLLQKQAKKLPQSYDLACSMDLFSKSEDIQNLLENCVKLKAKVIKVYQFHDHFLSGKDISHLFKNFEVLLSENSKRERPLIIGLLVNQKKRLKRILDIYENYQSLSVVCYHYCFSFKNTKHMRALFDRYSNFYLGTSFLFPVTMLKNLKVAQKNIEEYQSFFEKYASRLLFETAMIFRPGEFQNERYYDWFLKNNTNFLEEREFTFYVPGVVNTALNLKGLQLQKASLKKIYFENANSLLNRFSDL
ncbi:MAG: hypothetical protein ACPGJV_15685 [Bacteriovoracaceae bacterium]